MNLKIKNKVAGFLAASMVLTILPPAMPVYAASPSSITFDVGYGPNTNIPTNQIVGEAGTPIVDLPLFADTGDPQNPNPLVDYGTYPDFPRPNLPKSSANWPGYTLEGWYTKPNGEGSKLAKLPYAFPYPAGSETKYYAYWTGVGTTASEQFITNHQRQIGGNTITFFGSQITNKQAGETISTAPIRNIPGYMNSTGSQTVTPTHRKKFDGTNADVIGNFSSTNYSFVGIMGNEEVTVTYNYVPDAGKKFTYNVEYVEAGTTTALDQNSTSRNPAETAITATPRTITGYNLVGKSVTKGETDDTVARGVYPVSGSFTGDNYSGKMPNQDVTVTYEYQRNLSYMAITNVVYEDNHGNQLTQITDPLTYETAPNTPFTIPVPSLSGYLADVNVSWTGDISNVAKNVGNVALTPGMSGGTITITYLEDLNDTSQWARISYSSGDNGAVTGDIAARNVRLGNYDLTDNNNDATKGINYSAQQYYIEDGWYKVGANGNVEGTKLTSLNLQSNTSIRYCFIEDPAAWFDVNFVTSSHGSIGGATNHHVHTGTYLDAIAPTPSAEAGYQFTGWYDSLGNKVANPAVHDINVSMTYTARFELQNPDPEAVRLNRPDAHGQLSNDGKGVIAVSDAVSDRKYVVTDMNGKVIETILGQNIINGQKFEDLYPGSSYQVYELSPAIPAPAVDSLISSIPDDMRSYPSRVVIPAVNEDNVAIAPDGNNNGKAQIVIRPAAEDSVYALVDEDGNVVYDWRAPTSNGSDWEVIFDNLNNNTNYTVVTKPATGSESALDKKDEGSNVFTDLDETELSQFSIEVIDGKIENINGTLVGSAIYTDAQGGENVKISADAINADGYAFKSWKVLVGEISGFGSAAQARNPVTITMPNANIVLVATYEEPVLSTSSNATVDYKVNAGQEGKVALDQSVGKMNTLRSALTQAADRTQMGLNRSVAYRIQFTKRSAVASESNALRAEVEYEDAYKAAWALDVDLYRYINGDRRPVLAGTDAGDFDVLIQLDTKDMNQVDYQLWKLSYDTNGDLVVDDVTSTMVPDLAASPENGGLFRFTANVDSIYVMTYSKIHTVTIKDTIAGHIETIKVRQGEELGDNADYLNWLPTTYTDSTGVIWTYQGLSKVETAYREYDLTAPVKGNLTLYAYYESNDVDWNNAKDNLINLIDEATDLKNSGNVSQSDKDRLEAAINEANDLLSRIPRPTTEELETAYENLKDLVDEIKNGVIKPPKPEPSKPSKKGGSGGGGTLKKPVSSAYPTYTVGTDGNWQLTDQATHQWAFSLNNGNLVTGWANVKYSYEGTDLTYRYHFNADGKMDTGWFTDSDARWYYFSTVHDGWFGHMITGWHNDPNDGKWYYLDSLSGVMATDWKQIDNHWYFFTAANQRETWAYNEANQSWEYIANNTERPFGSMFVAEATPDGYQVNHDGVWGN